MREIAILGAGAVGSVLGTHLADAGRDVLLVGREPHVEAIRSRGLQLTNRTAGSKEERNIDIAASTSLEPAEIVFLAMKTPDVEAGVRQVRRRSPGATVVPLQNGVRADELVAGVVDRDRIVSGVVLFHAVFLDPGQVSLNRAGHLLLGNRWNGPTRRARRVADLFGDTLPVTLTEDIAGARWMKLLLNLNNALPAITGLTLQEVFEDDELAKVAIRALWEGAEVVRAADVPLASVPGVPRPLLDGITRLPFTVGWRIVRWQLRHEMGGYPIRPSTQQSILRGSSSEIEFLNGEIVSLARQTGTQAPLNRALVEMVGEVEANGAFLDRKTVLDRVEGD